MVAAAWWQLHVTKLAAGQMLCQVVCFWGTRMWQPAAFLLFMQQESAVRVAVVGNGDCHTQGMAPCAF